MYGYASPAPHRLRAASHLQQADFPPGYQQQTTGARHHRLRTIDGDADVASGTHAITD